MLGRAGAWGIIHIGFHMSTGAALRPVRGRACRQALTALPNGHFRPTRPSLRVRVTDRDPAERSVAAQQAQQAEQELLQRREERHEAALQELRDEEQRLLVGGAAPAVGGGAA